MPRKKQEQTKANAKDKLYFNHLAAYARFVLENCLEEYVSEQLKNSREENIPLLKFLEYLSEKELLEFALKSSREFLAALTENKAGDYILKSSEDYVKNRIPLFEREQIVAEDITIVSFIRRKTLLKFLTRYTKDFEVFSNVMEEADRFVAESETASFNAFLQVQQEKISNMNAELAQRENELLEAQELAGMGSFLWDMAEGKSSYTPGVFKIFEMTKTSTLESFLEFVHADDRQKLREAIDKSFHNEGIYECDYRFIKNGKEKRIWSSGRVSFRDGKPINMKGTIRDVTREHRMIEELQRSEELSKQAQALTHIGNWTWNVDANTIEWSDEMYRIYGLQPQSENINFERFISLVHSDDRQKRLDEIQQSLKSLHAADYLMRIVNPDGAVKVLRGKGQVITDNNKKPVKLVGTCQDITSEYNLNKELQEKENYLNEVITNAPDAIIVIDETSTINLWNPKTEKIFGWKAEEVIGSPLTETIIPVQYREAHKMGMKRLLETGEGKILNKTLELTALHKQGKEFYISLTISHAVQKGNKLFIAFLRDITEEKQIKEELLAKSNQLVELNQSLEFKNFELERMNKELESFNYIASHDLQEPLRKIQTFTNRIIEKGTDGLSPASIENLHKISVSSSRMKMLIEDLLTFSQASANEKNFEITDMNMLLEDVKNTFSAVIEENKVIIDSAPLPVLRIIPFQIQQVLENLIGNAIKYSKEQTLAHIKISSNVIKGEQIKMNGAIPGKNYFKLKVEDNGIGFDNSNAEKIFELFHRLHSKDKYSGTGIGLAICKKIIQNHNGFIRAESVPGKGSVFYVYLPKENFVRQYDNLAN